MSRCATRPRSNLSSKSPPPESVTEASARWRPARQGDLYGTPPLRIRMAQGSPTTPRPRVQAQSTNATPHAGFSHRFHSRYLCVRRLTANSHPGRSIERYCGCSIISGRGVLSSVGLPVRMRVTRAQPTGAARLSDRTPVAQELQDEPTDPSRLLRPPSSFCLGFVFARDVVIPR